MIKLLPNENEIATWNGITVTTSRVVVQEGGGANDFSLTQFPVEDYRGIKAVFRRSALLWIAGALFSLAALVSLVLGFSINGSQDMPLKLPKLQTVDDVDTKLPGLRRQLAAEKTGQGTPFFRESRIASLERAIADRVARAQNQIDDANKKIQTETDRIRAMAEGRRSIRRSVFLLSLLCGVCAAIFFVLYSRSGYTTVEILFNNRADPLRPSAPMKGGRKNLEEAIVFVNVVEEYLNPFTGKLADPKGHRRAG